MKYGGLKLTVIVLIFLCLPRFSNAQQTYSTLDYRYQLSQLQQKTDFLNQLINYVELDPNNYASRRYLIHLAYELYNDYSEKIRKLRAQGFSNTSSRSTRLLTIKSINNQIEQYFQKNGTALIENKINQVQSFLKLKKDIDQLKQEQKRKITLKTGDLNKRIRALEAQYAHLNEQMIYTQKNQNVNRVINTVGALFLGISVLLLAK